MCTKSINEMELNFEIDETSENGQTEIRELIPAGSAIKVTHHNMYDYVRRYAFYKMVTKLSPAVKEIRKGVHDIISEQSLNGLTSEDWWLLG